MVDIVLYYSQDGQLVLSAHDDDSANGCFRGLLRRSDENSCRWAYFQGSSDLFTAPRTHVQQDDFALSPIDAVVEALYDLMLTLFVNHRGRVPKILERKQGERGYRYAIPLWRDDKISYEIEVLSGQSADSAQ